MTKMKGAMNVFTEMRNSVNTPVRDWKQEILDSIAYTGSANASVKLITGMNPEQILDFSSSKPRIRRSIKFTLIAELPSGINEARCCLCGKRLVTFPFWYHVIKYKVNHLAFFVCFDSSQPSKPSVKCYRRENV